jgi:hypothetical protein
VSDESRPTESFAFPPAPVQPAGSAAPVQPGDATTSSPFATAPAGQSPFATQAPPPAPVAAPSAKRRSGAATLVNVLLGFALVVAVGGVAFAAGRATAPTTTTTGRFGDGANGGGFAGGFGPNASGAPGRGQFGGLGAGSISIEGKVTAVTADSITIQLPSGQSVTIPTSDQTTYHSQTAATAADVTTGTNVQVQLSGGGRFVTGGNGNGQGNNGNGNGNANGGPAASGAPNRGFGSASSITVLPAGS